MLNCQDFNSRNLIQLQRYQASIPKKEFEIIAIHVNSSHIAFFYVYLIKPIFIEIIRVFLNKPLFHFTYMLNCNETRCAGKTNIVHRVAPRKNVSFVVIRSLLSLSFIYIWLF